MEYNAFHFADNSWLWGLCAIPAIMLLYFLFFKAVAPNRKLERFADRHLLPHLITSAASVSTGAWRSVLLWSCVWACGILAMAGPRWNYTDMETFKPAEDLVVLLDISKSMDAQDVKPSRLVQAREKVDDLLRTAQGMDIGLVAYAADAHMISPITDDARPILNFLPYIDTSLPSVQGNLLRPALTMASHMLAAEPGNNKSILIISDGGFHDNDIAGMVGDTVGKDTTVYTIGIGTQQGAPIPANYGGWVKDADGRIVISRLQAGKLREVSAERGGFYAPANYNDSDIRAILRQINGREIAGASTGHKTRYWEEHFYLPVAFMALLILPWFRRGYAFAMLAVLLVAGLSGSNAYAATWQDMFLNQAQQAHKSYQKGNYTDAATRFDTPYRRGVAQYKAGQFAQADASFAQAEHTMPAAQYNQGNAQVMQGKYKDAIASYESVLKRDPLNANATHNLAIARKLLELEQQKKQQQKQQQSNSSKQQNGKNSSKQSQSSQGKGQGKEQKSAQSGGNTTQNNSGGQGQQNSQQQSQGKGTQKNTQNSTGKNSTGQSQSQAQSEGSSAQNSGNTGQQHSAAASQNSAQSTTPAAQQTSGAQPHPGTHGQGAEKASQSLAHPQNASQEGQTQAPAQNAAQAAAHTQQPQSGAAQPAQAQQGNLYNAGENGMQPSNAHAPALVTGEAAPRTQKDIDADQWLNRVENDPHTFLKNQFLIETQHNGTTQGEESW
jgi:Ca-activated chloride channel family protein